MTGWVADYSFARPDLAALKQAGCAGIARYATDVPGAGHKAVDAAEIDQARALGLTVVAVMETVAQPALRGYQGGVADATAANLRLDQLGNYPRDCWLYYAAEDPNRLPQSAWPVVVSYFQGVASVAGRPVGGYGGVALLDHLGQAGLISRKWAVEYWGGHNGCHLSQYDYLVPAQFQSTIDANAVIQDDYGQHPRPGTPQGFCCAEEPAMFSFTVAPDGVRKDAVWVAPNSQVMHGWSASGDLAHMTVENLGGVAKTICAHGWDKAGNYTVVVHGTDDRPYLRVSTAGKWIDAWTPLPIPLHPPATGSPGSAYDDTALKAAVAALATKVVQAGKALAV